jgi:molybdopterin synthase catalytic subunit/molybdopterin converting factor small subunit
MKVKALYFGGLRARLGLGEQWLELPEGSLALDGALAACGHLGPEWVGALRVAVNEELTSLSCRLKEGDELALLPPVSGGSPGAGALERPRAQDRIFLSLEALDPFALEAAMADPACGAWTSFVGRVRCEHGGRAVLHLDYEAYEPVALKALAQLATEARQRWALGPLVLAHRLGRLHIGEAAVLVAVASGHRDAAFEACRFLIEGIKAGVPVWKHEFYADGTEAWVGAPAERTAAALLEH